MKSLRHLYCSHSFLVGNYVHAAKKITQHFLLGKTIFLNILISNIIFAFHPLLAGEGVEKDEFDLLMGVCTTIAPDTWDCGTPGPGDDLIVNHTVTITGNVNYSGTITVNSGGTIIYTDDFTFKPSASLVINSGGNFQVGGDLRAEGSAVITINSGGCLTVDSNFNLENSAILTVAGKLSVNEDMLTRRNTTFDLQAGGVVNIGNDFYNDSDKATINGELNVGSDFINTWIMTGSGTITYVDSCSGAGNINTFDSSIFCDGSGIINLGTLGALCSTDTILPVISGCPADLTVALAASECDKSVSWTPPLATDNCTLTAFTSTHNPGDVFPAGTTTVTYTATDDSGNTAECSFNITVEDNIAPVITSCTADIVSVPAASECDKSVSWTPPLATDNCTLAAFTITHNPGDVFPPGATIVTYTATDDSGNTTECSFNVTVEDNIAPVIANCPADIVSVPAATECDKSVSWTPPLATDNCTLAAFTSTHNPGDVFPPGATTVTYTATDDSGNTTDCSFNITIEENIAPVIDVCPADIFISQSNPALVSASWNIPMASDNCGTVSLTGTHNPGDNFPEGITVVTYTARDNAGNTTVCSFNVEVRILGLIIYKAFTPDGDNINDTWWIENIALYPNNQVMIFDRWGSAVYEAKGYNNVNVYWDGSLNVGFISGKNIVPSGTYFYTIDLGGSQPLEKGFIELVR